LRTTNVSEPVYNLRVADYRTYFVGAAEWGFAVWVHNACIPEFHATRPFHLIVRDNTTSSILFMGRISNPLELQNDVNPTVVAPNADFDGNLIVDGADFLAWQRGVGQTTGAELLDGDSDGDGDVDRSDLGCWVDTFGAVVAAAANDSSAVLSESAPAEKSMPESLSAGVLDAALKLNWSTSNSQAEGARLADASLNPSLEHFARALGDSSFAPIPVRATPSHRLPWRAAQEAFPKDVDAILDLLAVSLAANDLPGLGPVF
jgi:hypothetical protein